MAITPFIVDQIKKFKCLELSATQGLSSGVLLTFTFYLGCQPVSYDSGCQPLLCERTLHLD